LYRLPTKPVSQKDMFGTKENGVWKTYSTEEVQSTVNKLSAGLLQLGEAVMI